MNEEIRLTREVEKVLRIFRIIGWGFLTLGSIGFVVFAFSTFDRTASIRINGVETFDFASKLGATAFTVLFPIVGAVLVFTPQRKIAPLFRSTMKQAMDLSAKLGTRK